jgi:FdhD protein
VGVAADAAGVNARAGTKRTPFRERMVFFFSVFKYPLMLVSRFHRTKMPLQRKQRAVAAPGAIFITDKWFRRGYFMSDDCIPGIPNLCEMTQTALTGVKILSVTKFGGPESMAAGDVVAVEEPLEIQLEHGPAGNRSVKNLSVTMRTPGTDHELAAGFLMTEGIVCDRRDILEIMHAGPLCREQKENTIRVRLANGCVPVLPQADRNFYTTSSCGVCGKSSVAAIRTVSRFSRLPRKELSIGKDRLYGLPAKLVAEQRNFSETGGIHACGLFSSTGELLLVREDVGRHNALDKLVGRAFREDILPLDGHILVLSGRASFELVQKAAMAGIPVIAAMGAPSSLAVELALEFDITLIGFLNQNRFNIYTSAHRIF